MKMESKNSKLSVATEMFDIVYNDIMHLWSMIPKDDFWVAQHFIDSSFKYLKAIKEIRNNYEHTKNPCSN